MSLSRRHKDKGSRDGFAQLIGLCLIGFVCCGIYFTLDPAKEADRLADKQVNDHNQVWLLPQNVEYTATAFESNVQQNLRGKTPTDLIRELYDLGTKDPAALAAKLEFEDVFGTKVGPDGFECSSFDRYDSPTIADQQSLVSFRENAANSFIFYQHLRKAGGTGFCDLANSNLPKKAVPQYYCMPDNRGSMATPPWSDMNFTSSAVANKGYRIIANEWDTFSAPFFKYPNVVLATTIRHPIDRWYSQYRFEHLEHRDGSKKDAVRMPMLKWYKQSVSWTMGTNYYVKTFLGEVDDHEPSKQERGDFYWTYHKFNRREKTRKASHEPMISWTEFETALTNLRRFHLILVMEWLDSSASHIEKSLGWHVPPKQVLPHEVQAVRVNKKSKTAREMLEAKEYSELLAENVFDLLLFEIAKRIYLERIKR